MHISSDVKPEELWSGAAGPCNLMGDAGQGRIRLSSPFKALVSNFDQIRLTAVAAGEFRPDGKGRLLLKAGYSAFMSFKSTEQFGFGGVIVTNVSLPLCFNL